MAHVKELAYVVYQVSNLADWEHFGVSLLGMQLGEKVENGFALRTDAKAYRWLIEEGPADDLVVSGYEVENSDSLDALARALHNAGAPVTEGDSALAAARKVDRILITEDPIGNRVELVTGFQDADAPFESPGLLGAFVTGTGGAGHQVLIAHEVSRGDYLKFYVDVLGFKISDFILEQIAPDAVADLVFLHCNPRHHTVAFGEIPSPKRMHHFMVEVTDIRDVGLAYDRCLDAKQPLEMTLGMHPNDHMFSFYVVTPSGFSVEYGWGGLLIDEDDKWEVETFDRMHSWGHRSATTVADLLTQAHAPQGVAN